MHPTADTSDVIYFQSRGAAGDAGRSAARVHKTHDGDLPVTTARGSFSIRRAPLTRGAALRIIFRRAWREGRGSEFGGSRQARNVSTTHPNKPMHPTADTSNVINSRGSGRRVIGGVRRLNLRYPNERPRNIL
jgi:hypothetical protein